MKTCPNCGDYLQRGTAGGGAVAGFMGGIIGALVYTACASYQCPRCGPVTPVEDDGVLGKRRSRKRQPGVTSSPVLLAVAIGIGFLLVCAVVVLVVVLNEPDKPSTPGPFAGLPPGNPPNMNGDGQQPQPVVNPPGVVPPRPQQPPPPPPDPRAELLGALSKLPADVLAPALVEYEGLRFTRFKLRADDLLPCFLWAEDGKSFYCVEKSLGALHHVSLGDFKVLRSKTLNSKVTWLSACREGLLVSQASPWQLSLVDPQSLEVLKSQPMPEGFRAVSSPKLSGVYLGPSREAKGTPGVGLWDPRSGKLVNQFLPQAYPRGAGFLNPAVTPDGKYLFAVGGGSLIRYRIQGAQLILEQGSADVVEGYNAPCEPLITADSQYVHLHVGGGNVNTSGGKVFRVGDLTAPALTFRHAPHAGASAVDVAGQLIYSQDYDKPLVIHDAQGNRLKDYKLHPHGEASRLILPHPGGRKLLVLGDKGLSYVEVPG